MGVDVDKIVKLVENNRNEIVTEAVKKEVIRALADSVKDKGVKFTEFGAVKFEMSMEIDEKCIRIAHNVVDKVIELIKTKCS